MAGDSGAKVRLGSELVVNLSSEEVFRRVDNIMDTFPMEQEHLLELKSRFKTLFSDLFHFNIEISGDDDGRVPATSGNSSVALEELVERKLQEVAVKCKTYPSQVKERTRQMLAEDLRQQMEKPEAVVEIPPLPPSCDDRGAKHYSPRLGPPC